MAGRFAYVERFKYPHMIEAEAKVWNRFIVEFPDYFDGCDYDWRVGDGMSVKPEWEENIKRMATMITQKRIDVVGWNGDHPTIVEVKNRAELSTLGQILGYFDLFVKDFPNFPKPEMLVLCHMIGDDDRFVLEKHGIMIIEV